MKRMIPNIFFEELRDGLELFVEALGFEVMYQDDNFAVVIRDNAKIYLVQDAKMAAQDRTPITLETDTIDADYESIKANHASFLDPEFRTIITTPWGREFGLRDASGGCLMIRQSSQGHVPTQVSSKS